MNLLRLKQGIIIDKKIIKRRTTTIENVNHHTLMVVDRMFNRPFDQSIKTVAQKAKKGLIITYLILNIIYTVNSSKHDCDGVKVDHIQLLRDMIIRKGGINKWDISNELWA